MKAVAILILCFISFVAAQTSQNFQINGLQDGEAQIAAVWTTVPVTANGYVSVSISAPYAVDVCFQEGKLATQGTDLSSCNAEGYIPGSTDSGSDSASASASDSSSASGSDSSSSDSGSTGGARKRLLRRFFMESDDADFTNSKNLWLRNTDYTITAAWSNQPVGENTTNPQTGDVSIDVSWTACPANSPPKGIGANCSLVPVKVDNGTLPTQTAVTATAPVLLQFDVDDFLTSFTVLTSLVQTTFAASNSTFQITARRDAAPFVDQFDQPTSSSSSATSNTLLFSNPEGGHWFVLITATEDQSVTTTLTTSGCAAGTFPDGSTTGACVSPTEFYPSGTANETLFQANGTTFPFPAATITYFTWTTETLLVGVVAADHSDTGAPQLYASTTGVPSNNQSEFSRTDEVEVNFLNVGSSDGSEIDWVISVMGDVDFEIWAGAGCANDCSDNGVCNQILSGANGYCICNEHYKDFECGTKTLKTIYIVLIAIGGAIVLAIAIGVPVGCYIKNRKRARYERV